MWLGKSCYLCALKGVTPLPYIYIPGHANGVDPMADDKNTLQQMNKSGFPFQLRVERDIQLTSQTHGWSVESREHPWSRETGESGFIDIVLAHNRFVTYRLVIECKRIKADDARQLRWIFLLPERDPKPTMLASCFEVEANNRQDDTGKPQREDLRVWDNVNLTPLSFQSEFCILPSDEQRRQPILEGLATEVLDSIEGLAQEEVNIELSQSRPGHKRLFIFPAIVTNAEIAYCHFDPAKVNISDGTLAGQDVEIKTVPSIRFRKSLATTFPQGTFSFLRSANKARERTVFVVNASSISEFLTGWEMGPSGGAYAYQILSR